MKNFFVGLAFTHQRFFKKNKINFFKHHLNALSSTSKLTKPNLFLYQPSFLFFLIFKLHKNILMEFSQNILNSPSISWSDFFVKTNTKNIKEMRRVFKYSFKNHRSKLKRKYFYIFRRLRYVWEKHLVNPEKTYLFTENEDYSHSLEFLFTQTFKFKLLNLAKMIFNYRNKTKINFKKRFKIKKPKSKLLFNNLKTRNQMKNKHPCSPYFYQIPFTPATLIKTPWNVWIHNRYKINFKGGFYYLVKPLNLKTIKKKKIWSPVYQKELSLNHLKKKYYAYYLHKTFDKAYNHYWELFFFKKNLHYLSTFFKKPNNYTAQFWVIDDFKLDWIDYYSDFMDELILPLPLQDRLRFFVKTPNIVFFPTFHKTFFKNVRKPNKNNTPLAELKQICVDTSCWDFTPTPTINTSAGFKKNSEFFAEGGLYFSLLYNIADTLQWEEFKPTMGPEDLTEVWDNFLRIRLQPVLDVLENSIICRWFFKNMYFLTPQTSKLFKNKLIRRKWFKPYKKKFKQARLIPMRKKKKLILSFSKHFLTKPLNEELKNYFKFFFNLENQFFKKNWFVSAQLLNNNLENFENINCIFENDVGISTKTNPLKNQFSNSLTLSNYNPVFFLPNTYKNTLFEKTHRLVTKLNTKYLQNYLNNFVSDWIRLRSLVIVQNNLSLKNFVFVDSLDIVITELIAYFIRLNVRFFKRFPIAEFVEFFVFSSFKKDLTYFKNFFKSFVEETNARSHKKIFSAFDFMLKKFLYKTMSWTRTKGIKFEIAGKISVTGNAKKRRKIVKLGNYSLTNKQLKIDFLNSIINTPTGVLGYKIFITW